MIKLLKLRIKSMISCENLSVKLSVNLVQNFVNFFYMYISLCKTTPSSQLFYHLFHPLFHKNYTPILTKTFSHFHTTYYYNYDILKINNINNRKV